MDYKFKYRFVHIAPRKIRLVIDLIRKLTLMDAMTQLRFLPKLSARPVLELLESATDAVKKRNVDVKKVKIKSFVCDEGPMLKRRIFGSRGKANVIRKRMSHITLTLTDDVINESKKKTKKINNKKTNKSIQRKK